MYTSARGLSTPGHKKRLPCHHRQALFVLFLHFAVLSAVSISVDARRATSRFLGGSVAETGRALQEDSSESSSESEGPWEGCDGQATGFREKDDTGCVNPDDRYYAKALEKDVFGGIKYTGSWQSCKNLCRAAAQGSINSDDLECGKGHYITYNKDTGDCYFYRPPSAESNGCSQWRSKDSDRLGMYCGPDEQGSSGSDSSDSEDNPPPPPSPPPSGDSSESEEDSSDSSAEDGGVDYNRKYTGWVGEYCSGSETIRTVKCTGSDKDCRELCANECDKEKDCVAFMTDYDFYCELYSKCDVVNNDVGCDDCTVQVCLENCPEDTKPYYVRSHDTQECYSRNRMRPSYDTECGKIGSDTECSRDQKKKVRDDCADRCVKTPGCGDFFLRDDHSVCELYSDCDFNWHSDQENEGGFVGSFRHRTNSGDSSEDKDSSDGNDSDDDKDSSDSADGPWNECQGFEPNTGWIETANVGCINSNGGYFHKAQKGDVYPGTYVYGGTYNDCKSLCMASVYGHIDDSVLKCRRGDYVTYSESSGSCYFYNSPGGDNGCDEFRPKGSDRTAAYCGRNKWW